MMLSRTIIVESGLGGLFWFKSFVAGCEAPNVTYKARIRTTPQKLMHGEKKDLSRFRVFGCRGAWIHLDLEKTDNGKHMPRKIEAIHLGFEPMSRANTRVYSFLIQERYTRMSFNQVRFDKEVFPLRIPEQDMIEKYKSDISTDILFRTEQDIKWIHYNRLHIGNYTRVHYDITSDMIVMRIHTEVYTFTQITQIKWLQDKHFDQSCPQISADLYCQNIPSHIEKTSANR